MRFTLMITIFFIYFIKKKQLRLSIWDLITLLASTPLDRKILNGVRNTITPNRPAKGTLKWHTFVARLDAPSWFHRLIIGRRERPDTSLPHRVSWSFRSLATRVRSKNRVKFYIVYVLGHRRLIHPSFCFSSTDQPLISLHRIWWSNDISATCVRADLTQSTPSAIIRVTSEVTTKVTWRSPPVTES